VEGALAWGENSKIVFRALKIKAIIQSTLKKGENAPKI
jgi:hypothetical protein